MIVGIAKTVSETKGNEGEALRLLQNPILTILRKLLSE